MFYLKHKNYFAFLFVILSFLISCSPTPKIPNLSEAHKKFIQLCKEEFNFDVTLQQKGNTLWVYVPLQIPLFEYKAVEKNKQASKDSSVVFNVKKLDGEYKGGILNITYDITKETVHPGEDPGYINYTPEELTRIYQNIFGALSRIYFDVEDVPTEQHPEFFVLNLVDVTRGLKLEYTGNLEDYKWFTTQAIPHEEYVLRSISEITGDPKLINNYTAEGLTVEDVTWDDFLRRQLLYRIKFKFTESSHPPSGSVEEAITEIINDMNAAYPNHPFPKYRLIK